MEIKKLTIREKEILDLRKEGLTFEQIGKQLGINPSRVKQIETIALKKKRIIEAKNAPAKEVVWRYEYGMLLPFCPVCGGPAYEEESCVFCGQKFLWVETEEVKKQAEKQKELIVDYEDIHVEQVIGSWGIYVSRKIGAGYKMLAHLSCSREFTRDELINLAKQYAERK